MSNPEFIFITISLVVLVGAAYWMRIPRAAIPLGIVYLILIMLNEDAPQTFQKIDMLHKPKGVTKQKLSSQIDTVSQPIQPLGTTIQPKPLTFDSGRTKKDLLLKKTEIQAIQTPTKPKVEQNSNQEEQTASLHLRDIQICKNVVNRNPVSTDVIFTKNVDSLFCYTRIQNTGRKQEVKHVWYYEGQLMTQVRYNIKRSNIYRSWTHKKILPNQIGNWRVDVQDSAGNVIGSKQFQIINLSKLN